MGIIVQPVFVGHAKPNVPAVSLAVVPTLQRRLGSHLYWTVLLKVAGQLTGPEMWSALTPSRLCPDNGQTGGYSSAWHG